LKADGGGFEVHDVLRSNFLKSNFLKSNFLIQKITAQKCKIKAVGDGLWHCTNISFQIMKSLSFLCAKNTLFGMVIGCSMAVLLAFKVLTDPPACAIALDKMNVFYVALDNPITIVARGVAVDQLIVQGEGVTVEKVRGDQYVVHATRPGEASITVSGGDLKPMVFNYRVKRFPDPTLCLGGNLKNRSGYMGNGEFKAQGGIAAIMTGLDIDASCETIRYELTYLAKGQAPVTITNLGARFGPEAQALIQKAKPGDQYFFDDVKVRCPGDVGGRNLGGLSFTIK
jgi:hypothetical protein